MALIGEGRDTRMLGAAWYRRFSAEVPGYGFIDADTPELAIGVVAVARGQGVGSALLVALVDAARHDGYRALSLSVERTNPALRLYQRLGFVPVGTNGDAWTMRADLTGRSILGS